MSTEAEFNTGARLDSAAFLIATLDLDHEGYGYLIDSLETRADCLRVICGLSSLCATLASAAHPDPRELVAQWAQLVALDAPSPPGNADERRRRRGHQ